MINYIYSLLPLLVGVVLFESKFMRQIKDLDKYFLKLKLSLLVDQGKHLERLISARQLSGRQDQSFKNDPIPKYKFYTGLYEEMLSQRKTFGVSIDESLRHLREGLVLDSKFEKKLKVELQSSFWQFFFISLITWSFTFISITILNKPMDTRIGLLMGFIQISGAIIFCLCFYTYKRKVFSEYGLWFSRIYQLKGLLMAGVPISYALKECQISELFFSKKSQFQPFKHSLETSLKRLQSEGAPILNDLKFCLDELWFTQDCDFEDFLKKVLSLKLVIILLFYLGAYFLYLYSFISTFMHG
jgi:hypothetical protein